MNDRALTQSPVRRVYPAHGWIGLVLITVFWSLNWTLDGLRTHWIFFPLWLGYCLAVDGFVFVRKGTSLFTRDWRKYIGLFLISAPVWWIFEIINWRLDNWHYDGGEFFTNFQFWAWATLNFTTVIPAVLGSSELIGSFNFLKRFSHGVVIRPDKRTMQTFFGIGWVMFIAMIAWPNLFFPFIWLSLFFILEPINIWLGNRSLTEWTRKGDWRPVFALWFGVLMTAFFWEMWNSLSYPKWIYNVPWGGCCKIFEMPLLGYGGYLPFALELYVVYHLVVGLLGNKRTDYVQIIPE